MKTYPRKKGLFIFSQILIFIFWLLGCVPSSRTVLNEPTFIHEIAFLNNTELLWSVSNVYAMQNDFEPSMSILPDLVCVLGDISYPPKSVLSCINATTREISWQKFSGDPAGITTLNNNIFVSYYGVKGVEKYDVNGNLLWKYPLTGVIYTYAYDNQVQLFMIPEKYIVLNADTGSQVEELVGEKIIFSTAMEKYSLQGLYLESRSKDTNQLNWSIELGNQQLRLKPLFTKDFVFFRTGQISGAVYAVNKKSGEILWQTDSNMISNIERIR